MDPDVQLMMKFAAGEEEAFVQLYQRYRDRIFNFCRRILGDSNLGEEATQDVFLKLYRSAKNYRPEARFSTYLYRIAKNHCLNLHARHDHQRIDRRNSLDVDGMQGSSDAGTNPETFTQRRESAQALRVALLALPEQQRNAFVLVHYQGLRYDEVSEIIGATEGAVKSLIFRARRQLALQLKNLREPQGVCHAL